MKLIFIPIILAVMLTVISAPRVAQANGDPPDTEPPVPECVAVCNAGFFLISATDNVTPDDSIQLFIEDTGTTTVFGPFSNPEVIKYIQSNRTPTIMPKNGSFFIFGSGPPNISAVDSSGNVGVAACQP
jgi:hypothetical protein